MPDTTIYSLPGSAKAPDMNSSMSKQSVQITGEQNRVLFNNIRPSSYRDKTEYPIMSGYDDIARMGSTMKSFTMSKMLSTSLASREPTKDEPEIITKFRRNIGSDLFNKMRDIYEKYSILKESRHFMDTFQYHRFLKENKLLTPATPILALDLMFSKNNKLKAINFTRFIEILYEIAQMLYSDCHSELIQIEKLVKEFVLSRENSKSYYCYFYINRQNYIEGKPHYDDWFIELEKFLSSKLTHKSTVCEFIETQKSFLLKLFGKYQTNHPKFGVTISHDSFLKYCNASEIIPKLLSYLECSTLFYAAQRTNSATLHSSYLNFGEFVECLCFIAFHYHTKPECSSLRSQEYVEQIQSLFNWLQKKGSG